MLSVPEPVVRPERPEERLLEDIVGAIVPDLATQEPEHLGGVLGVERLERGDRRHGGHHPLKRGRRLICETGDCG